ncbi:Eisosome component PIL1-domain-containing protein [Mycena vitilis]|nr:Eisosome component PIL1-domain-containing protein [Mycena vitilis]
MFKSAATKIAHNSTLPALALSGNKDLRPLQDLITAEKVVLISMQKLAVDFSKASEALRVWGVGEGDDLGDILSGSTTVLGHFSAALSGYASREHAIRDHLKSIRTREEALDELKRRRKATHARADSAEKKLNKMGPEHKNLMQQTDVLNGLQAQIRQMDSEIMTEEAALGDFKRSSARALMGLKFGGLGECCEKGCVVAEVGRAVVAEISEEPTPPGLSRTPYMGHQLTQQRVIEAERAVGEVVFSALPSGSTAPPPRLNLDTHSSFNAGTGFAPEGDAGSFSFDGMPGGGLGVPGQMGTAQMGGLSAQNTGMTGMTGMQLGMQNTGMSGMSGAYDSSFPGGTSGFDTSMGGSSSGFMDSGNAPSYAPPAGSPGGYAPSGQGGYSPGAYGESTPGGTTYAPPPQQQQPQEEEVGAGLSGTGVGMGGGPEGPAGGRFATFPVRGRGYSLPTAATTATKSAQDSRV